jgi:hypothetical protein
MFGRDRVGALTADVRAWQASRLSPSLVDWLRGRRQISVCGKVDGRIIIIFQAIATATAMERDSEWAMELRNHIEMLSRQSPLPRRSK